MARELHSIETSEGIMKKAMCLNCGENPAAAQSKGTVPLCESCAKLVTDLRGVKYEKPVKISSTVTP